MSIILKGIDLPKEGEEITLAIFHDGDIVSYKYWLPKEAEAIQIPKGHGRLIDGNKLRATLRRWTEDEWNQKTSPVSWAYAYEDIIDLIDNAPTILEAEESR